MFQQRKTVTVSDLDTGIGSYSELGRMQATFSYNPLKDVANSLRPFTRQGKIQLQKIQGFEKDDSSFNIILFKPNRAVSTSCSIKVLLKCSQDNLTPAFETIIALGGKQEIKCFSDPEALLGHLCRVFTGYLNALDWQGEIAEQSKKEQQFEKRHQESKDPQAESLLELHGKISAYAIKLGSKLNKAWISQDVRSDLSAKDLSLSCFNDSKSSDGSIVEYAMRISLPRPSSLFLRFKSYYLLTVLAHHDGKMILDVNNSHEATSVKHLDKMTACDYVKDYLLGAILAINSPTRTLL